MLQRIRDSFGPWVLGVVIGLIGVTFIFWGVDNSLFTQTTFAAKVNGENIPLTDFENALQAEQRARQQRFRIELTDDMRRELRREVLEGMVQNEALRQRVEEAGYRVSDQRVTDFIRSTEAFQVDGDFSMEIYRGLLANQGLTPAGYEERQRTQLELFELRDALAGSTFLTPSEFRRFIELYNQRRDVGYALFSVEAFTDRVTVDDAAISEHYQNNQERYQTIETVDLEYIELAQADIAATIEVTDEALQRYYEDEQERFQTTEELRARHILVNAGDDPEAARAKAEDIAARIRSGEDFAALASELSDDAGNKAQGGDLGWIAADMLPAPLEETLFALPVGEVGGPVQSDVGFHVLRVDERRGGETRSFEAVRGELESEYQARRAEDLFYDRANRLEERAFSAYNELASVSDELELPLKTLNGFPRSGDPAVFTNSAAVVQAAFDDEVLSSGRNSALVNLGGDHVLVLRVLEHHPSTVQPLDVVRDGIHEELMRMRAQELADAAASAFLADLLAGGDPTALAATHNGTWHASTTVDRTNGEIPTEVLAAAFGMPKPAPGDAVEDVVALANGGHAVVVVTNVEPGRPDAVQQAERDLQQRQLAEQSAFAELSAYAGNLRNQATIRIPDEILNPTF